MAMTDGLLWFATNRITQCSCGHLAQRLTLMTFIVALGLGHGAHVEAGAPKLVVEGDGPAALTIVVNNIRKPEDDVVGTIYDTPFKMGTRLPFLKDGFNRITVQNNRRSNIEVALETKGQRAPCARLPTKHVITCEVVLDLSFKHTKLSRTHIYYPKTIAPDSLLAIYEETTSYWPLRNALALAEVLHKTSALPEPLQIAEIGRAHV